MMSVIQYHVDTSYIFNLAEEEHKQGEKKYNRGEDADSLLAWQSVQTVIFGFYLMYEKSIYIPIQSPPPEV